MKNGRRPHLDRRNLSVVAAFTMTMMLASPAVVYLKSLGGTAKQGEDAILEMGDDFHPPVEITLVKSQAGIIGLGKKFSANEDWFKGLTISLRNTSDEPITHISLRLRFPRPKGQEGRLDFVEPLNYGESPIPLSNGQLPFNSAQPIMPGGRVELKLSDSDYQDIRGLLAESNYPANIKKIRVSILMLGFANGTVWIGGKRYEPDKNRPGKLIPLEKKVPVAQAVRSSFYRPARSWLVLVETR